jgi:transcriptional regulator with XRE-family HTH domain
MRRRKGRQRKATKEVLDKKLLIGERVKALRGKISQDAIAAAGGTTRRVVGEIERSTTDYRIESLLSVIDGLEKQLNTGPDALVEKVIFAPDSMESDLVGKLIQVLRHGDPTGKTLVMTSIETAAGGVRIQPTSRSGTMGHPRRSA